MPTAMYMELNDRDWLYKMHVEQGLDHCAIARVIGCSTAGARCALLRFGIYQPGKRSDRGVRLAHIDPERMLSDATRVSSWPGLGKLYNVHPSVVQSHAMHHQIHDAVKAAFREGRPCRRPVPPEENELLASPSWIAACWLSTHSLPDVAKAAGSSPAQVRKWMKLHGLTVKEIRQARDLCIVSSYEAGESIYEVAAMYEVDAAAVYRILVSNGVDTTRRRGRWIR